MLDFVINIDNFLALFGAYLAFFVVLWVVAYTIKVIR